MTDGPADGLVDLGSSESLVLIRIVGCGVFSTAGFLAGLSLSVLECPPLPLGNS